MVQILLWYYIANDPGTESASRPEMPPEWAGVNNFRMVRTGGFCGRRNGVKGRMECHGVWTMGWCEHELILDGGMSWTDNKEFFDHMEACWSIRPSGLTEVAEGEAKWDPRWSQKLESK